MLGLGHGLTNLSFLSTSDGVVPTNTVAPVISGTPFFGNTLTSTTGTWTSDSVITYSYQWTIDNIDIPGATSNSYILVNNDRGKVMRCKVRATDADGTSSYVDSNSLREGSLALDFLSVSSSAAYSVRKLRYSYLGNAIRVRRSSDNAETDIGFVNGTLDTTTLLTFCGVGSGFVTTWYDQSGNGKNALQTTAARQSRIVNLGAIDTFSDKPSVYFSYGSGVNALVVNINDTVAKFWTISTVLKSDRSTFGGEGALPIISDSTTSRFGIGLFNTSSVGPTMGTITGTLSGNTNDSVITGVWSNSGIIKVNGTQYGSGSLSAISIPTTHIIGARFSQDTNWLNAKMGEYILFPSELSSADVKKLEQNQGQYYGITVI